MPRTDARWWHLPPRGPYPWPEIVLPWGRYVRERYLFWRIRIPFWLTLAAAGWALLDVAGLVSGIMVAYIVEAAFSYRKPTGAGPTRPSAEEVAAARSEARRIERRWRYQAVPSPAGWQPLAGSMPGWDWTPPDGWMPRLDRVPARVRLWSTIPFGDRYAYTWMWAHGGWDVLPPTAGESH